MKKLLLLALSALSLCGCEKNQCQCVEQKTYTFEVKEYRIAILTSEPQEKTHDIRLAYCVRGVNEAFIEVAVDDEREKLELVYTGYQIKYTLDSLFDLKKVSNNGWELVR